jgi:2-keto-4-pentenoate hydratase/2-oxohepta-3-ene-1,7-dioic acid hydratase in catechol pathway
MSAGARRQSPIQTDGTSRTGYRIVSYAAAGAAPRAGLLVGDRVLDLEETLVDRGPACASVCTLLEHWEDALGPIDDQVRKLESDSRRLEAAGLPLNSLRLEAPVLYPSAVFCAGTNYRDHYREMRGEDPPEGGQPFFFLKTSAHSIIGPEAPIRLPAHSAQIDWEAELGVVIGRSAKDVSAERALDCVAGYLIVNDLSARDVFRRSDTPFGFDWLSQKCFDGSSPMGPWITPADRVPDPQELDIKLWVNDELMQDSNTGQMIFGVAEQIAYLSSRVTLRPGDVIATGTPSGVGRPRGIFLKPGDRVRIAIDGLGELCNPVVASRD